MRHKRTNTTRDEVLVAEPMSTEDALALRGSGWEVDLEQQRAGWDGTRAGSLGATVRRTPRSSG
jgi:hypothetical protein